MEYVSSLSLTFTHFLSGGDAHSPNTRVIDPFQINPVGVSVDPSAEESLPHVQEGHIHIKFEGAERPLWVKAKNFHKLDTMDKASPLALRVRLPVIQ